MVDFFSPSYFAIPHQHSNRGWNDNKWEPLQELLAIKGNRDPQYTTPVSLAKLKQITPPLSPIMQLTRMIYLSL